MRTAGAASAGIALLLLAAPPLLSQQGPPSPEAGEGVLVRGIVTDQVSGEPVAAARVVLVQLDEGGVVTRPAWEGTTDQGGTFVADRMPTGAYELRIEALSFAEVDHALGLDRSGEVQVQIEMVPEAVELDPVVVTAFSRSRLEAEGFYERREAGWGYTLDRDEIEVRNPSRVSDLFIGIAGARVYRDPPEPAYVRLRNNCNPLVVLDGNAISFPMRIDALVQPHEVEAIEVYHGASAPTQFLDYSCGTVMIWTRELDDVEGQPWSWLRLLVGASLFGWLVTAFH